jgi:hypothetical protein
LGMLVYAVLPTEVDAAIGFGTSGWLLVIKL